MIGTDHIHQWTVAAQPVGSEPASQEEEPSPRDSRKNKQKGQAESVRSVAEPF
jgi:hypothetical protein